MTFLERKEATRWVTSHHKISIVNEKKIKAFENIEINAQYFQVLKDVQNFKNLKVVYSKKKISSRNRRFDILYIFVIVDRHQEGELASGKDPGSKRQA